LCPMPRLARDDYRPDVLLAVAYCM
jgi:hypothetical protein